jgi:hypothetical protein
LKFWQTKIVMRFTPIVIVLVAISVVGAIAVPFGGSAILGQGYCIRAIIHYASCSADQGLSQSAMCRHTACNHCNGGELACITPRRDHDNILKTIQCCNSNIGGYVLQAAGLIGTTIFQLVRTRQAIVQRQKN